MMAGVWYTGMNAVRRKQLQWLLLLVILTWLSALRPAGAAAGPKKASAAAVRPIADGVYVRLGEPAVVFEASNVANTGIVIGNSCVAVIDTGGSRSEGQALKDAVRELTDLPVCVVINTHVHPDHMLGNEAFRKDEVEFIGHEKLARAMALRGDTYLRRAAEFAGETRRDAQLVGPERTVENEVQFDLGERVLTLHAHATAHTDNDLTVLDEATGTFFAGDLVFLEHLPVLDGSINGWIEQLEALEERKFARVVPGHGPVETRWPEAAEPTLRYLQDLRKATRTYIADGGDLGSAQRNIEVTRPERWRLIEQYHERNVAAAFAELEWED